MLEDWVNQPRRSIFARPEEMFKHEPAALTRELLRIVFLLCRSKPERFTIDDVEVFSILKHLKLGTYVFEPMHRSFRNPTSLVNFALSRSPTRRIDWYSTPWLSYLGMHWKQSFFKHHMDSGSGVERKVS